jgi:hypothetical protein
MRETMALAKTNDAVKFGMDALRYNIVIIQRVRNYTDFLDCTAQNERQSK